MKKSTLTIAHQEKSGTYYRGDISDIASSNLVDKYAGQVQLILTSPPFPLNTKKNTVTCRDRSI